jgi:hypothetical protein
MRERKRIKEIENTSYGSAKKQRKKDKRSIREMRRRSKNAGRICKKHRLILWTVDTKI